MSPPNGLFFCHSLPTDEQMNTFDFSVFDRELAGPDYARKKGPVYQLIWGRGVSETGVAEFAEKMGVKLLITGHESQESGFLVNNDRHLIVASPLKSTSLFLSLSVIAQFDVHSSDIT